jgi:adenylosuccinate synthase
VLFEGAQGTMLDLDHGTYPFITSSNTTAGGASTGTGVPPTKIHGILGISKAYTTRVGEGPFPTELHGPAAELLRTRGNEFGSVTGRPRRCGWVDAVALRYAARINGFDTIALTKLDVLDACETVSICVGYRYEGDILTEFPEEEQIWHGAEPVYEEMSGWQSSTRGLRDYADLPTKAREYLDHLSELCGVPFGLVSTGAGRDEIILTPDSVLTRWYPTLRGGLPPR